MDFFWFALVLVSVFFFASSPHFSRAAFTEKFNYQGKLYSSGGGTVPDGNYDLVFRLYADPLTTTPVWTSTSSFGILFTDSGTTVAIGSATCGGAGNDLVTYASNANEATLQAGQTLWNVSRKESAIVKSINTGTNQLCIYHPYTNWSNGETVTNRVYVKNGLFSTMLGDFNSLSGVDFNQPLYLGVTVGSDSEMKPRRAIGTVPSALNTKSLNGLTWDNPGTIGSTTRAAAFFSQLAIGTSTYAGSMLTIQGTSTNALLNVRASTSASALYISDGGQVGIGTTSPQATLHVKDSGSAYIVKLENSLGYGVLGIDGLGMYMQPITANKGIWLYPSSGANGIFGIASNGNVGIGTSSPAAKLEVVAPANTAESARFTSNYGGQGGYITIHDKASSTSRGFIGYGQTLFTGLSDADFGIRSQGGLAFGDAGAVNMYIKSDGNVGIGTTDPANKLTVAQSSGGTGYSGTDGTGGIRVAWPSGYGMAIDAWDGASPRWGVVKYTGNTPTVVMEGSYSNNNVIFNSGGFVGIGTFSPGAKLHIQADANTSGAPENSQLFITGSTSVSKRLSLAFNTSSNYGEISAETGAGVYVPILINPHGGNVGIGTTSPIQKFSVVGNAYMNGNATTTGTQYAAYFQGNGSGLTNLDAADISAGTLAVSRGGTGATTLTGAIKGNGTGAMTAMTGTTNYLTKWTDANTLGTSTIYDSGSKIGIGTMFPSGVLDLGASTVGRSLSWGGTSANFANIWAAYSSADIVIGSGLRGSTTADTFESSNGGNYGRAAIRTGMSGTIKFYTSPASAVADGLYISPSERMVIDPSGHIGIGTSSPLQDFTVLGNSHIQGNSTTTGVLYANSLILSADLSVANGGTGASTLTGFVIGNGTNALTSFATSSAGLASIVNDETGSGALVFGTSPTVSTLTVSSGGAAITGNSSVTGTFTTTATSSLAGILFANSANNNVGIGTNAPVSALDVSGGLNLPAVSGTVTKGMLRVGYALHSGWAGGELNAGVINDATLSYASWIQSQNPADYSVSRPLLLNPNGGNVGIGTTSPSQMLTVGTNNNFTVSSAGAITANSLTLANDLSVAFGGTGASTLTGFVIGNGTNALTSFASSSAGLASIVNDETGSGALVFGTGPTLSSLTVSSGGAAITGNSSVTGTLTTSATTSLGGILYVNSASGDVGIGTSSPSNSESWSRVLDVYGTTDSKIIASTNGIETGLWSHNTGMYGAPAGGLVGTKSGHPFSIVTSGAVRMTVTAAGNVGIGTTTPIYKLDINTPIAGDSYSGLNLHSDAYGYVIEGGIKQGNGGSLKFTSNNNGVFQERVRIDASGFVGIGTSTPGYRLDVNNGAATTYPLSLTSANTSLQMGALNGTYAHFNTTAGSGFYFYQGITTAGQFSGSGAGLTGTAGSLTAGGFSGSLSGDVTGTQGATVVADDSHAHTVIGSKPNYSWSSSTLPAATADGVTASFVRSNEGWQSYGTVLNVRTYTGGGGTLQLYTPYSPANGGTALQYRSGDYEAGANWTGWKTLIDSGNISSQTVATANAVSFNGGLTTVSSPTFAGLTLTNDLTVANGGTGVSTLTGVAIGNGTNAFVGSSTLSDNYVTDGLTVSGGTLGSNNVSSGATWTTLGALTIGDGGDTITMNASNWDVSATGAAIFVGVNAGAGLIQGTAGLTVTGNTSLAAASTTALTVTGNAILNTLTATGAVALSSLSLTTDLAATHGGTGTSTAGPAGSVIYSNGTSHVYTGAGTTGQILWSNAGAKPTWVSTSSLGIDLSTIAGVLPVEKGGTGKAVAFQNPWNLSYDGAYGWRSPDTTVRAYIDVALSADGKIQTTVIASSTSGQGIYVSNDYGRTWVQEDNTKRNYIGVDISSDGRIQTAVVFGGGIYGSTDYGATWTQINATVRNYQSVAMSADGKYQTAVVTGNANGQGIYNSSDYGATWTQVDSNARYYGNIAMSADGRYQTVGVTSFGGYIYISSDYGQTWSPKGPGDQDLGAVAVSADGRIQTMAISSSWHSYAGIYVSTDYGNNWTQNKTTGSSYRDVAMTADAKFQIISGGNTYTYSTDYGSTWSASFSGGGNSNWSIDISSIDGQVQTMVNGASSPGYIYVNNANSYVYGNVGIGTSTPTAGLDVISNNDSKYGAKFVNTHQYGYGLYVKGGGYSAATSLLRVDDYQDNNKFIIDGTGKVGVGTATPQYALDVRSGAVAGFGAYVNTNSYSGHKEGWQEVDVLDKIKGLKIDSWIYKAEFANGDYSRHLYPTTDDFYDAFGLGSSRYVITPEDIGGVALRGVKELAGMVDGLKDQIGMNSSTSAAKVEIINLATSSKIAILVRQENADKDIATFQNANVEVMKVSSDGEVKVVGTLSVDGRTLACSGACPEALAIETDETRGDIGAEGKMVAAGFREYCPGGYIWVAGSAKYGTMPGFCVMSDLATMGDGGLPQTASSAAWWTNVSLGEAQAACQALGEDYHLLSDNEWMTMAGQIARNSRNDSDVSVPGIQLIATPSYYVSGDKMIHDLVGASTTVWTDLTIGKGGLPTLGIGYDNSLWQDFGSVDDLNGLNINPPYNLSSSSAVGKILIGANGSQRGFVRGFDGLYSLDLSNAPDAVSGARGFRCAK